MPEAAQPGGAEAWCALQPSVRYLGAEPREPAGTSPSPAHLGEGFEGGGPAELLPTFGHRLSRLLGGLGCFFHTLLDLPAKVASTDFVKTLLRQRRGRCWRGTRWGPAGAPPRANSRPGLQRAGAGVLSPSGSRSQDWGAHAPEGCLRFLGRWTLGLRPGTRRKDSTGAAAPGSGHEGEVGVSSAPGWPRGKALPLSPAQEKQQKESLPGPPGVSPPPPPCRGGGRGVQGPSFPLA